TETSSSSADGFHHRNCALSAAIAISSYRILSVIGFVPPVGSVMTEITMRSKMSANTGHGRACQGEKRLLSECQTRHGGQFAMKRESIRFQRWECPTTTTNHENLSAHLHICAALSIVRHDDESFPASASRACAFARATGLATVGILRF